MCYSVKVPTEQELAAVPVEFQRDNKAWVNLRQIQEWESSAPADTIKDTLGLARKPKASQFRGADLGHRAYPKQFLPTIVGDNGRNWLRPLRYSLRPHWATKELASKYCYYNARLDRLLEAKSWKPLLGRNHALIPFSGFYEWVTGKADKKVELKFNPEGKPVMWAPAIWDTWQSKDGKIQFSSVALITDEPPPEVEAAGHDRCPIFLSADAISAWLTPSAMKPKEWHEFLIGNRETVTYTHRNAA